MLLVGDGRRVKLIARHQAAVPSAYWAGATIRLRG